ncbi:MAG: FAD-dependent oxidoreductase [Saprospiraceae bacterium]|nr:FAD-dependent oxidoreductase [Saprospiraceae bacterium]
MERRKFVKNTLAGMPLVFLSPSFLPSLGNAINENPNGKTVIVIGAGISGLAAAKKLKNEGFTVIVLEAQDRVGGRLRTNRSLGVAFDEGASWIHGTTGNPLTALAQQAGMTTAITNDNSFIAYDLGGLEISDTIYAQTEAQYYTILDTLMNSGNLMQSFETVFNTLYPANNTRLWKFLLSTYFTFDRGDLNNTSSLIYDEGLEFGGNEVISTNGYDTIPNYLAIGLDVRLNQRVTKIDYLAAKTKVTHNGTVTEADYVLVTVPLGVLKNNSIQFVPSLPTAKQTAITKLGMNCVNKFVLTWNTAFWDNEQYIAYTPNEKDKFNYFVNVKKFHPTVNALMTFAYADYARQTESMTDAAVISEIMAHLRDIYGSATPNPTSMLRTKWNSNINSFGAYSYTAIQTEMHHFDDLAAHVNNQVFFAGEHTHIDYFSTAHGAYLSGLREADKIKLCPTPTALPVTWHSDVKATNINNYNLIEWSVASQVNNQQYIIEHSSDGARFLAIGEIPGDGNNNDTKHYEFKHSSPQLGINYYRVKQVDYDGNISFSNITSVNYIEDNEINIFPNPAGLEVNVGIASDALLKIKDINGKLHLKQDIYKGINKVNLEGIPSGMLIFSIGNLRFNVLKV